MKVMICNNSNQDIELVKPYFLDFANTGVLHEDIADLFSAYIVEDGGYRKVIVDIAND